MAKTADDLRTEVLALPVEEREAGTLTWGEIEQRFAERRAQRDA